MAVHWIDVTTLSFNVMLLLERVQLSWFPGWLPEKDLAIAFVANPAVEWYLLHKCPDIQGWLEKVQINAPEKYPKPEEIRMAEVNVMQAINDLLVYAVDPALYDAQPFLGWDSKELTQLVDFKGKMVIDVGAGTGRLALVATPLADAVFAVEPVTNLRRYMKEKARKSGVHNLYPVDGLITDMPFPDQFAHVTMGGHVFGDDPSAEYREMRRVTKRGGLVILCPGNVDRDNDAHQFLVSKGFKWSSFEEPEDGKKRKYWKEITDVD